MPVPTISVGLRLPVDLYDKLAQVKVDQRTTIQEILRQALEEYLAKK